MSNFANNLLYLVVIIHDLLCIDSSVNRNSFSFYLWNVISCDSDVEFPFRVPAYGMDNPTVQKQQCGRSFKKSEYCRYAADLFRKSNFTTNP